MASAIAVCRAASFWASKLSRSRVANEMLQRSAPKCHADCIQAIDRRFQRRSGQAVAIEGPGRGTALGPEHAAAAFKQLARGKGGALASCMSCGRLAARDATRVRMIRRRGDTTLSGSSSGLGRRMRLPSLLAQDRVTSGAAPSRRVCTLRAKASSTAALARAQPAACWLAMGKSGFGRRAAARARHSSP